MQLTLHCSLTNVSSKSLRIKKLSLPCAGWWSLGVIGLTTDGRVLLQSVPAGSIISAESPPEITITPNETVTGGLNLASAYPLRTNPRNIDVLLLQLDAFDFR